MQPAEYVESKMLSNTKTICEDNSLTTNGHRKNFLNSMKNLVKKLITALAINAFIISIIHTSYAEGFIKL
jgi:hypothetical protein